MEINFGNNIGIRQSYDLGGVQSEKALEAKTSRSTANLTIGEGTAGIASAEPTANVPDEALTRDDPLGKLMSAAFNLAPPPMPDFASL